MLSRGCRAAQRYSPRRGRRRRSARLSSRGFTGRRSVAHAPRRVQGLARPALNTAAGTDMDAIGIQSRTVIKVVAIVIVAVGVAVLLNHVIVEIKTTIRWLCAAIFLALALSPLVDLVERARIRGRSLPRWAAILVSYLLFFAALTFLVLAVIPPIVREVEQLALAAADLRQGLPALGEQQRAVPGAEPEVRDHAAAHPGGRAAALEARRRRRGAEGGHGRAAQQPGRGDRRAHARLLPAPRRRASCSSG